MKQRIFFCAILILLEQAAAWSQGNRQAAMDISLEGIWKCKLDPFNTGLSSNGVQLMPQLSEEIILPGSTDEAGKGYRSQGMTSLRLTRAFEYKGAVWYEKEIYIPENWTGKDVQLYLERVHWKSDLWVNGHPAGMRESLSTPHVYDISDLIRPGEKNTIRIRVNNELIYNIEYSHAASAETQTNWNGIIGKIQLQAVDKVNISDVQVYPDAVKKSARLLVQIKNQGKHPLKGELAFSIKNNLDSSYTPTPVKIEFSSTDSLITIPATIPLGEKIFLWDEFSPTLYQLNSELKVKDGNLNCQDISTTTFGVRDVSTKQTQFEINGRPAFIRSTVNSAEFPLTGYPSMDLASWVKILKTCKDYGLNAMRFHSWCPPEAAFQAADQLGMYLQVENSDWRFTVGKDTATNIFLSQEADRILDTYGNHPSFVFFCEGNELVGPSVKSFLSGLVSHWKQKDSRHFYTASSGYPVIAENEYEDFYGPRPQHWKEGLNGRFNVAPMHTLYDYADYVGKFPVPMITHEIGQWCVYPNFKEIPKFKGVLKPYNYELFLELLRNNQMLDQADQFTMASGKFQVIQKKEEIESYLRTPGMGGYTMLQLNDFPGQGTSPVGVVDVFWDSKPYVSAKEFHRFQNAQVPLLRISSFTWQNDQALKAVIEFANYGQSAIKDALVHWTLKFPDGTLYAEGQINKVNIPIGSPEYIGELSISLNRVLKASRLDLQVSIENMDCRNDWSVWVYPAKLQKHETGKVLVAYDWNEKVKKYLEKGGKVLLLADTSKIKMAADPVFSGISWNTVWSGMPPNMLGVLCDPEHPSLKNFPTESHSNWQWWDVVRHSTPMVLSEMPASLKPLVQMIPDWNNPRKIGLVFEAKVGNGSLLVTSVDVRHDMDQRPVARQFLYSLEQYVSSDEFHPSTVVSMDIIDRLIDK